MSWVLGAVFYVPHGGGRGFSPSLCRPPGAVSADRGRVKGTSEMWRGSIATVLPYWNVPVFSVFFSVFTVYIISLIVRNIIYTLKVENYSIMFE